MQRFGVMLLGAALAAASAGCDAARESAASVAPRSLAERAARRAFHGAPPVIPHPPLTGTCVSCHTPEGGRVVTEVGVAPANPHMATPGLSDQSRCKQCHVFRQTEDVYVANEFAPMSVAVRQGERAHALAPPTLPHPLFMREDCQACHAGAGARPEIVCQHADRLRCMQCHVEQQGTAVAAAER
jgi:cytochrome c-type protein NapB